MLICEISEIRIGKIRLDRPVRYLHDAQLKPDVGLQLPQESVFMALEAKVENNLLILAELQSGHLISLLEDDNTSSSNFLPQSPHTNSYIGIDYFTSKNETARPAAIPNPTANLVLHSIGQVTPKCPYK